MPAPIQKGPFLVCQKSGKIVGFSQPWRGLNWFFPLIALAAAIWWLIRVLPKPSRAAYPCQRVAMPIALGGLSYILSLFGVVTAFCHARKFFWQHRFVLAAVCVVAGLVGAVVFTIHNATTSNAATVTPNAPIGIARGINPGRVVWSYDPAACSWSGSKDGTHWWDSNKVNQACVDAMLSAALRGLTSTTNDAAAWDALFRSFNQRRGLGNISYAESPRKGIAIKINQNPCNYDNDNYYALNGVKGAAGDEYSITGNPHLILALVKQLVTYGVAQTNIVVCDPTSLNHGWGGNRTIGDNIYLYVTNSYPSVRFVDGVGNQGRELALWPSSNNIVYPTNLTGEATSSGLKICQQILDAGFFINLAIMKSHGDGPTICGKNNYGSISGQRHGPTYGSSSALYYYSNLVPLMGHQELGEKTLLFMIDALYGASSPNTYPTKWKMTPFKTNWPNSVFLSQDAVAIDSVGFDFLNAEWGITQNTDYYLQEAAYVPGTNGVKLSGVAYRPTASTNLFVGSLGTAEHWNNSTSKQYTRNLGTGTGIELVANTDANLVLSLIAAPGVPKAGFQQTYTLIVTNAGPATATGVMLTNIWPVAATFVSATTSQGSWTTNGSGLLSANVGTLTVGGVATVNVVVAFPTSAAGLVTNATTILAAQRNAYLPNTCAQFTSTIQVDTVGDGIPDWWRDQYFGGGGTNTNSFSCATCDATGTGMNNMQKFLAGLNPTNPASVFRVTSAMPTGAGFVVTWKTGGPRTNVVQATNGNPGGGFTNNFQDISGWVIISVTGDTTTNYTDVGGATNTPSRYYRVRLVP